MQSNELTRRERLKKRRATKMILCALLSLISTIGRSPAQRSQLVEARGGANFLWFDLQGCDRDQFSILPHFQQNAVAINNRLVQMFNAGQRRLRIGIPPLQMSNGNSAGSNVEGFLSSIRRVGFEEVEIALGSVGDPPQKWIEWHEDLYRNQWKNILSLRPIFLASGLHYYIDLLNEGIPADNQPLLLDYARRLWNDYTNSFGRTDTVGFSVISTAAQDRFRQIPKVYGDNPPNIFDIHIYDDSYRSFIYADERLKTLGYARVPWIIGEAFYNDADEAVQLARAIQITKRRVLFLLEWPLSRARTCDGVDVLPIDFREYIKQGF